TGENPQNYILMTDLYLLDYSPSDTGGLASLDGNNFVINILSWNQDIDGNVLQLAMFNNVVAGTTLKNLIINVYHASSIVVDTTRFSNIEIAGLAINNYGIIYNCHVTAFESDFTRPKLEVPEGINVGYSIGQIDSTKTSKIAGFVLNNSGLITNSRVGGKEIIFANAGAKPLLPFNIVGQGDIAGFVYDNSGSIASSYFDYGTILNKTSSGTATFTTGFVGTNSGNVHLSYSKGVGSDTSEVSLSEAGINTANVSAGFAYTNRGEIGDCFSNILLTSSNDATKSEYSSGRLTSGFVYDNQGLVERCYTASKIEDAKTTQMNFVGGDNFDNMKNSGFIRNSYYYNMSSDLDDVYARADINISVRRITEPDLATNFYGFTFANSMQELNGVWHITNTGPELVSANQIAVSSRYLANEKYDDITGELVSYALPYHDNYEYGSKLNPIIIRNAIEFNKVFGGDHQNAGSAISRYYDLDEKLVFGNYRIVSEIDLSDLITDDSSGVKVNSSNMTLSGGMVDGNKFVVNGLELVAKIESTVKDYGMFAALKQDAIIMNMRIEVIGVSAVTAQNVGAVAGTVENSKLINIYLFNGNQGTTSSADVVGNNIVGGIVGKVVGTSELKNLQTESINAIANHVSPLTSQRFNRNETPLNKVNSNVSYAGGIAGVADIYKESAKSDLKHNDRLKDSPLAFLYVKGNMHIYGSAAGGIVGYLGPQTLLRDVLLELSEAKNQKLLGYNFSAGGIVGQCYGDIDMARAEHEYVLQSLIENSVQAYYKNPSNETIERGNLELFEHDDVGKYEPKYIGGIVGELITGNISHSYSKIPVRNTRALYAGGIAGAVTFAENESINNINLIEVYTFSDAFAVSGVGGFAGYIEQTRTLSFHKVNLVNYWSLCKNESNQYYMPEHYYDIYAATGTRNQEAKLLNEIVNVTYNDVKIKENYLGKYDLPIISHEEYSEDIYVISKIIFDSGGANQEVAVEKSCARLASLAYIEMIDEYLQSIIPLYEYENARTSGSVMDTYFVKSGWDPNYWKRYTDDMLPRLISIADVNIFYIVVAEDLLNIVYYPDATFIVIGKDGNGIVKCGDYMRGNNLDIRNFSGVLKGYDNSGDYGFDFQSGKQTFIQSTEAGAKIYNLTIKNLGSDEYQEGDIGTFVGASRDTEFENLNFVECSLNAYANSDNSNIGLLCGHIRGGYIANISFEDCKIDVRVQEDIMTLNVGLMAGLLTAPATGYMQIADISAYLATSNNNTSSENLNSIRVNVQGYNVSYVNTGTIAGKTEGAVYLNYTSKSIDDNRTRNLGVSETPNFDFKPDTASGETKKGMVIEILGTEEGIVGEYNAGIGFGRAGVLNLSHQRADAPLVIGGVIVSSGQATIKKAVVGGYIGKSMTSSAITSNVGVGRNYMYIDCDLEVQAENVTAGMLIGEAGVIYSLRDVDTYGTINVTSTKTSSFVGGMVGVLNSDLELRNSIVHTVIDFKDELSNPNNEAPAVGGFIGMVSSSSVKIKIGEDNYKTKYLGTMTIDSNKIYAGGIIGAFNSSIGDGAGVGVKINSAVFGGEIIINSTKQAFVGGIVGSSLYEAQTNECSKTIESCFVYGNIYINETFDTYFGNTYAGGVIGRGSPATEINSNDCISTIYTKYTQVDEILTVNALVGETNGAFTGRDIVGDQLLVNNYSHQMSLCLDNSGIAAKNIYYKRNIDGGEGEQDSMLDIVQDYISQLDGNDMERQVYEGSKLNPFEIKNSTYGTIKTKFETDVSEISPYAKIKYFVISENLNNNLMSREKLSSSHLIGDGFSINTNQQAVFSIIDENSTVTGFKVKAQIESTNSTTLCEG
ncbi:MAG: hypothetical protein PHV79_02015, partial [Clostridia bacterium]|nr:hypothetical protein [Clostridia bacterium]